MKLDHIGVATADMAAAKTLYGVTLGLVPAWDETVDRDKVHAVAYDIGGGRLELLEPLGPDSPVAKFLEKRGEGMHHLCFEVENIAGMLADLKRRGVPLVDESPRPGAHGRLIAFLHPRGTGGVLIELSQKS